MAALYGSNDRGQVVSNKPKQNPMVPGAPDYYAQPMEIPTDMFGNPTGVRRPVSPTYTTDPNTGYQDRFDPVTGTWSPIGGGGSGSGTRRTSGAGGELSASDKLGPASLAALQQLYQPTPLPDAPGDFTAPSRPISGPEETQAEAAALTTARERSGRRSQAALRTLAGLDAANGRYGSRLEHADQRSILESGLSDMNDTERQLLENRANRNASISDQDFSAADRAGELTYNTKSQFPMQLYDARIRDKQRIATLLGSFGLMY